MDGWKGEERRKGRGMDGRGIEGQSRDGGGKRDERRSLHSPTFPCGILRNPRTGLGILGSPGRWMDGRERDRGREVGVSNGSSLLFVHGVRGLWSPFVLVSTRGKEEGKGDGWKGDRGTE